MTRFRYACLAAVAFAAVLVPSVAHAKPPVPDPAFIKQVPGSPCTPENPYEQHAYGTQARYPGDCKRIRFLHGPILVRPGQNDAIIGPVTIEKPAYDGYITRFKPDLIRVKDGKVPPVEQMHLHHGTWLSLNRSYGDGPFFAAGEEKTIFNVPDRYGLEVRATDAWALLYMVHNALPTAEAVWIAYDVDFVAKSSNSGASMIPLRSIWLDVQKNRIHPDAPSTGANPVFNVQRQFGRPDPSGETSTKVCRWPDDNCANFDVYGRVTPQQGRPISLAGADWTVTPELSGTLIGLGGHVHPGGIRDEVSLVRNGVEKPIFISDALYWNFADPNKIGAPKSSWNFAMTGNGEPLGWKVKIKAGDVLRLNAVYDAEQASWYENMGIVVGFVAPNDTKAPAGVDVFTDNVVISRGVSTKALVPQGPWNPNGFVPAPCTPDLTGVSGQKRLCMRGSVTHGWLSENANTGESCATPNSCAPLPTKRGKITSDIVAAGFTYGNADLGLAGTLGIPRVRKGQPVRFWNADGPARIYHTFTACKAPCTGGTTVNYPTANGGVGATDFESMNIGFGLLIDPAKSQIGGSGPYDYQWFRNGFEWEYTPTQTGTATFYCRIHPSMRGAFEVVDG